MLQGQLKQDLLLGTHGKVVDFVHATLLALAHPEPTTGGPQVQLRIRFLDQEHRGEEKVIFVRACLLTMGDGTFVEPGVRAFIEKHKKAAPGSYGMNYLNLRRVRGSVGP